MNAVNVGPDIYCGVGQGCTTPESSQHNSWGQTVNTNTLVNAGNVGLTTFIVVCPRDALKLFVQFLESNGKHK